MRPVAYLDCPACIGEQLFVLYEPPWDEHMSACAECGHVYGYTVDSITIVDDLARVTQHHTTRPVLDRKVLEAGIRKFRSEIADGLKRRHGAAFGGLGRAYHQLDAGLATEDHAERARLLNSTAPGLRPKAQ